MRLYRPTDPFSDITVWFQVFGIAQYRMSNHLAVFTLCITVSYWSMFLEHRGC